MNSKEQENISLLKCSNLSKRFASHQAIENITYESESNHIGLLGPNGSGKTTFIKLMLGLIRPTSGSIDLNMSIDDTRVIPDHPALPLEMTIDKWLSKIEKMHGSNHLEVDVQTIFNLRGDWKIKNLSAGQRRKVALFPAFYGEPKLFVLDEPTNFLDIVSREQVLDLLWAYVKRAKAKVILATHRIDEMRMFSSEVVILREGKVYKTVQHMEDKPKSYSVEVTNTKLFENIISEKNIEFSVNEIYSGLTFELQPSINLWESISEYHRQGGSITKFNTNDDLKHTIQELVK